MSATLDIMYEGVRNEVMLVELMWYKALVKYHHNDYFSYNNLISI